MTDMSINTLTFLVVQIWKEDDIDQRNFSRPSYALMILLS